MSGNFSQRLYINFSDFEEETIQFGSWIYTLTVILSGLFVFGILFNLLSILSILLAKAFNSINLLIINLAIADITYALGIPMFLTHIFSIDWPFGVLGCQLFFFADYIGMIVGVFTVSALSIERFFDIADKKKRFELYSSKFKMLVICVLLIIIWIFAIVFPLPMILSVRLDANNNITNCKSSWNDKKLNIFFIIKFIFIFLFPFTIISVSSTKLLIFFNEWRKNSIRRRNKFSESKNSINLPKKKKSSEVQPTIYTNDKSSQISINNLSSISNTNLIMFSINSNNKFSLLKSQTSNYLHVTKTIGRTKSLQDLNLDALKVTNETNRTENIRQHQSYSFQKSRHLHSKTNIFSLICCCHIFGGENCNGKLKRSIRRKASRLVLIIVLFFFIQWIPLWIFHFYDEFFNDHKTDIYLANVIITVLSYSNTVANPVMYMLVTYNFKSYCKIYFQKKKFISDFFLKRT